MTEIRSSDRITKGYEQFVAEATEAVDTYSTAAALDRFDADDVVFVDVRDATERLEHGTIPGSIHASRGMLEFHIDPESPYFIDAFGTDKEFVFYCSLGGRSVLAAQRAREMGLDRVSNVEGGFTAWLDADGPAEEPRPTM